MKDRRNNAARTDRFRAVLLDVIVYGLSAVAIWTVLYIGVYFK